MIEKVGFYTFVMIVSHWTGLIGSLDSDWYRCNQKILPLFPLFVVLCLKSFLDQFSLLLLARFRRGH